MPETIPFGWSQEDIDYMQAALRAAEQAAELGEVPVGAVVVLNNEVIASGGNRSIADSDASAHAEVVALRAAGCALGNYRLSNATLYVTLEPCIMCAGAIAQARVGRVVFAAYDNKAGALGSVEDLSDSKALNHHYEINGGLLEDQANDLLKGFFRARR